MLTRPICDNPDIVNWPIARLLELDNNTPQWASASILMGSKDPAPKDFFLDMSKEALAHYNMARDSGHLCELRHDETIMTQAKAFVVLLNTGKMIYEPIQQDEYCFARAFGLIAEKEGAIRWPELKGHESNRLDEMEEQIQRLNTNQVISSKDHRVVQAIAMLALSQKKKAEFIFPSCVSKSWPQFWKFFKKVS